VLVGPPAAEGELYGVRLADDDHAGSDQLSCQRRRAGGAAFAPNRATAGGHAPFELNQILERDRNAVQGADGVARSDGLVGRFGGGPCLRGKHVDKGVQLSIQPIDALKAGIDNIDGRNAARLQLCGKGVHWQLSKICVHGWVLGNG
jgi:hypothetical protein